MAGFPTGGLWPVSAFDPDAIPAPQPPPVILADAIGDERQGRDYTSLTKSGNPLDQHIRHTAATWRNTGPSARDHGHRLRQLRHMDELTQETAESLVREMIQHLTSNGYCDLVSVTLNTNVDEGHAHMVVRDRITGERREYDVL